MLQRVTVGAQGRRSANDLSFSLFETQAVFFCKNVALSRGSETRSEPMGQLFGAIRQLIADEKYIVGEHASDRLDERGIMEWQVAAGVKDCELIIERPDATPNPAVEMREWLPDGTEYKAVWSYLRQSGVAKLVTVHFFDRG